jgi:hypothetical protein
VCEYRRMETTQIAKAYPDRVQTDVELVPWGSLQRSEYKSRLVDR